MEDGPTYGFDTLQIHAGSRPDPVTELGKLLFINQRPMFFEMLSMQRLYSIYKKSVIYTPD